ncbi:MAG TPA: putative cytokinetic ring protein SteA [Trebonia sp.]
MKVPSIRFAHVSRGKAEALPGIVGVARVDLKTKVLVRRLEPGEIAVIDHPDLDRVSADELIACRVAAVVNASKSITGRYPNLGPKLLLDAGIPLIDDVGKEVMSRLADGTTIRLDKDIIYNASDQVIAKGAQLTGASLARAMDGANAVVPTQIDAFATNTLEFLRRELDLLTNGIDLPELATSMADRHVLVIVRGYRYREDLRALRAYIREYRPVLLAVDGGADALLEAGYRPHMIIGDMDSVSDEALLVGAELVVHAYPDGRAPGMSRLKGLGLDAVKLPAPGTSEDVALLVADGCGASLIAVVGTHWTLEEFLDKGRPGMASTFLTHLRVGGKLVNARGVHQLYRSRISGWALVALVVAAAVTIVVAIAYSPVGPILGIYLSATWHTFAYWFTGLFK